jgi:hypothetical protein
MRLAISTGQLTGQLIDFGASVDFSASAVIPRSSIQPGTIFSATSTDGGIDTTASVPNWGGAEVMYVVNTSSSTFVAGNLVQWDKNFAIAAAATTDNTGAPIAVCLSAFSAGNVTRQGGWILLAGVVPVTYSVAATTGAVFLGTSLNATPTANTGGQILNATCIIAAAGSFTRAVTVDNGKFVAKVGRTSGIYPGMTVSTAGNTPIPTSTEISSIGVDGTSFVFNNAAVASGTATATFTHTGYGICLINRPFVQGQIT